METQRVECFLTYGGFGDVDALKYYAYELPDGSIIYADKAYNDYEIEDLLKEVDHIQLLPMRKKNSKRALPPYISFVQSYHRKRVETAGSLIEQLLPKSIHAVTPQGFELKVLNVARKSYPVPKNAEKQRIPRRHGFRDLQVARLSRTHLPVAYPRADLTSLRHLSPQRFRITGRLTPVYHTERLLQRQLAPSFAKR